MTKNYVTPKLIEKEQLEGMKFPGSDVLHSAESKKLRADNIERAMRLGNNFKGKVKIIFEDMEGLKQVETTVWGFTDKRVLLKRDLVIPIHCIHEVNI